ncbi:hypothetical protein [Spirosoma gilvum]
MKYLLTLLTLGLLLATCRQDLFLYEKDEFKGKVVLSDSYLELVNTPAAEATIYLSDNTKADPFLYSVKTDKEGIFRFEYQPDVRRGLYIVGKFTNSAGLIYTGFIKLDAALVDRNGDFLLQLIPQYPGGILKVTVKSDNSATAQPIKGADVLLFTSQQQANAFKSASPSGVVQTMQTNEKGTAFFYNLKTATYYAAAKLGASFTDQQHIDVDQNIAQVDKANPLTLQLVIQPTLSRGEIVVTVVDAAMQSQSMLKVFLFTNRQDALSVNDIDASNNPTVKGSIRDEITNATGVATFDNLDDGAYFVAVRTQGISTSLLSPFVSNSIPVKAGVTQPVTLIIR